MSRTRGLVLASLLLATGCAKRAQVEELPEADTRPRVLDCPDGTLELGNAPPLGLEVWCAREVVGSQPLRHGPSQAWYRNGRVAAEGAYAEGRRTGHWTYHREDGSLEKEGAWSEGTETGYWLHYNADGTLAEEGPMVDGGRHGAWVTYDPESGMPVEGTWVDGERDGVWVEHDAEGQPVRERVYRRGRLISQREL